MYCKICGLSTDSHLREMSESGADMLGVNFYEPSSRYYRDVSIKKSPYIKYTGVFVKAPISSLLSCVSRYKLDYAQLHGDESVTYCQEVRNHLPVIKVFRVDKDFDFNSVDDFSFCDFFLFDTKTLQYGGSGKKFDWQILDNYQGAVPFLLSGGIGPGDGKALRSITHPLFAGVDINSQFELAPGMKDLDLVIDFIKTIKHSSRELSGR